MNDKDSLTIHTINSYIFALNDIAVELATASRNLNLTNKEHLTALKIIVEAYTANLKDALQEN